MKVIIAPDKFKGSLSSFEVCKHIHAGLQKGSPAIRAFSFPMADGGDGFARILKFYNKTTTVYCDTVDPLGRFITSSYEWDKEKNTATIESAAASGLSFLKMEERNPLLTSTYGTGLMIQHAINQKIDKIILGLGGTATNDAGTGILAALGFIFEDKHGKLLHPNGGNLVHIHDIKMPGVYQNIKFVIACDVSNVLYGHEGAAFVYSRQKGADDNAIDILDTGLKKFSEVVHKKINADIAIVPGTGAAGGIAAGLKSFFDVVIKSGIDLVIDASGIKNELADAELVITGEGKIDKQTTKGKVVAGIANLAGTFSKPVIGICGHADITNIELQGIGLVAVHPIQKPSMSIEESMSNAGPLIEEIMQEIIRNYFIE